MTERDELLRRLSHDLAELVNTCVASLPASTQSLLAGLLKTGAGSLGVVVQMTPWPEFRGVLATGKDDEPIELFRVSPGRDLLRKEPTH